MTVPLTVTVHEDADPPVLAVDGEIDMANAGQLRTALGELTARHRAVTVDLTAVRYLDSAAIKVFYDHVARVAGLVVPAGSVIYRALDIAGLSHLVVRPDG